MSRHEEARAAILSSGIPGLLSFCTAVAFQVRDTESNVLQRLVGGDMMFLDSEHGKQMACVNDSASEYVSSGVLKTPNLRKKLLKSGSLELGYQGLLYSDL